MQNPGTALRYPLVSVCKVSTFRYTFQEILIIRKISLLLHRITKRLFYNNISKPILKEIYSMSEIERLDKIDLQILRIMQDNSRLTIKEVASRVSLSSTPVYERLKRLEGEGYIKRYIAVLDAEKMHQGFIVFCKVKMSRLNGNIAAQFNEFVNRTPQVTECYNISGSYDYLLKIHAPDMVYYKEFILDVLGKLDYLASIESVFVMDEVKHMYGINF